jgi:hypothetical protein
MGPRSVCESDHCAGWQIRAPGSLVEELYSVAGPETFSSLSLSAYVETAYRITVGSLNESINESVGEKNVTKTSKYPPRVDKGIILLSATL